MNFLKAVIYGRTGDHINLESIFAPAWFCFSHLNLLLFVILLNHSHFSTIAPIKFSKAPWMSLSRYTKRVGAELKLFWGSKASSLSCSIYFPSSVTPGLLCLSGSFLLCQKYTLHVYSSNYHCTIFSEELVGGGPPQKSQMRRGVSYHSEIPWVEICKLQWAEDQASTEAAWQEHRA